jgi:uroporphyrinogen decarboxylase
MTPKERLLYAVRFNGVDEIPTSYRGSAYLSKKICEHFGINYCDDYIKNYKEIIRNLGADFYSSGSKIGKFSTFVPKYIGPKPEAPYVEDHALYYQIGANSIIGESKDKRLVYEVVVDPPLAYAEDANDIKDGFLTEKLEQFDFSKFENKYGSQDLHWKKFISSSDDFICLGSHTYFFMICWALRGYEQFLTDLAFNIRLAEKIIYEVCEFGLEFNRRELESFGKIAEYYGIADDVASQYGMIISPSIFKKYYLPYYRQLIDNVKRYNIVFSWHCCGSVHKVLPCMIDAGIDIFDVVQTSAKDMGLDNIYRLYGNDVCIHGGIDVQNILIFKTPKEIKEEVKKIKYLWGDRGGVIIAPSHEALPETPVENVLAIYRN